MGRIPLSWNRNIKMDTGIDVDGERQENDICLKALAFSEIGCKVDYWVTDKVSEVFKC